MEFVAAAVAIAALLFAIAAMSRARGLTEELEEARRDLARASANVEEEVRAELLTLRRMIASLKEGAPLTREMILDGRLWADVDTEAGKLMLVEGEVHVLDVRTPQETAGGVIPGAQLIPVDQLEERLAEVPRSTRRMLVYCAGGGRSAAACEFLSKQGFEGLHNLAGGFTAWTGPSERPA